MGSIWWMLAAIAGCSASDAPTGSGAPADSGTSPPVYAGEVLHNGNFEEVDATGDAAEWHNDHLFPQDGTITVVADPRFGTYALDFAVATDGREFWVIQDGISPSQLVPGHVYELTGWFRTDHVGDLAFNYIVRGQPGDTPDVSTVSLPPVGPTEPDVWQHFAYDITIPLDAAPGSYQFWLHSIKFGGGPGHLTVDAVSLHPKP